MSELENQVAFVTGGAGGLGTAICRTLARSGCHVVVVDVRASEAAAVAQQLNADGLQATALNLDLTDSTQMAQAIEDVASRFGRLDILVNNAGRDLTVPVEELSIDAWDGILSVNLRAPFVLSRAVLPVMKRQGAGSIINIVSTAALRAWPNASAYHASKWGLLGFSHALHTEARPSNIRVTAVIAGGMKTPFLTDRFPDIDLNLLQDPQNVAETVRFILQTPQGSVIPEMLVLPMTETSWP